MDGMMIPFIMLLIITVGLILERKHHEDKIVDIYEEKFTEWKEHYDPAGEKTSHKELVGLVFMQDHKVIIETLNEKAIDPLERKKYTIKES
jgi:hypothetical protein